jgi:hypothetical protein
MGRDIGRRAVLGGVMALPFAVAAARFPRPGRASRREHSLASLKPLMTGLTNRSGSVPASEVTSGAITGVVAPLNWSDIETSKGVFTSANLESALSTALGTGLTACRLRISMGAGAPADLLTSGIGKYNGQVGYYNPQGGTYAQMPLWWTVKYTDRASALLRWLASNYDSDSRIADVTFSAPCTFYSEWPIRQLVQQNFAVLQSAGYTTAADQSAIETMCSTYAAQFKTTRVTFADSLIWADYTPPATVTQDNTWHTTFLARTRSLMGNQAVHGTNNLDQNVWTSPNYEDVLALGKPYSFQTQTMARIGQQNLPAVIEQAISHGASCIELPTGYDEGQYALTLSQMHGYSERLARNGAGL